MILWVDAQLSPAIAAWIQATFRISATPVRDLGLRNATDIDIFQAARQAGAVVMTKDSDFVHLQESLGSPPQVLWITCGNTSNARLQAILQRTMPQALALLAAGEPVIEIRGS